MTKTNWIVLIVLLVLVLGGWYFMKNPNKMVAPEIENMLADDGTLTEDELGGDMIEIKSGSKFEMGGDFDGIISQ